MSNNKLIDCYNKFYKVNAIITPDDRKLFELLQKNKHESAGSIIFNKYGFITKINIFKGGCDIHTWSHGHIINYHTHPNKYKSLCNPPSYVDYKTELLISAKYFKHFNILTTGLIFDKSGCWIFTPTKKLVKEFLSNNNNKKKIIKIILNNVRILNIQLSQPSHIINKNKNIFPKISKQLYIKKIKSIITPNINSNMGFNVRFIPKGKTIKIPNIYQCIENINSFTRLYNIPPNVELKLLNKKYIYN
jgi:hypothetical protein